MQRLVYTVVYTLCFSVLAACATTQTVPIGTLQSSDVVHDVVLTLTNGSKLSVANATVGPEHIRGLIQQKDMLRLSEYSEAWGAVPVGHLYTDITIPLSDAVSVARRIRDRGKTAALVGGIVAVGIAIAGINFVNNFRIGGLSER